MYNQSNYSGILDISSSSCLSGIIPGMLSNGLEIMVKGGRGSLFAGPVCGGHALEAAERGQHCSHPGMVNWRLCISAIEPLMSC
jgi:hypothetical protein